MVKLKLFLTVLFFSLFFLFQGQVFAEEQKHIIIVNPVRGTDFWQYNHDVLDTPKKEYEVIVKNNLPATWLVRYDGLKNEGIVGFLKSLNKSQETGLFLEITPTLAQQADVKYNQSAVWHNAKSALLTGYSPSDRIKLIDEAFKKYKEIFGIFPKSVGAWWIDAGSLDYMKQKYQIEANLDVSDQFSTDQYQVWGQYWSSPFYPSKVNALMPAQSADKKIGIVTIQWAPRDPFNGYGNGVFESTYSVQANDYLLHNLDSKYFEKLLAVYPQVTVGLENDFDWNKFGGEYQKQLETISQLRNSASILTMEGFAKYYQKTYPDISPNLVISANDPLGSTGKVIWYQTPRYRVGWFYSSKGSVIRDLREYNDSLEEDCLKKACDFLKLAFTPNQVIDDINYRTKWVIDEGKIQDFSLSSEKDKLKIDYKTQAGIDRKIVFLPNDISIDGNTKSLSESILRVVTIPVAESKKEEQAFISKINLKSFAFDFISNFSKYIFFSVLFFVLPGIVLSNSWLVSLPLGWVIFTLWFYLTGLLKSFLTNNGIGFLDSDLHIWLLPLISIFAIYKSGIPKIQKLHLSGKNLILFFVVLLGSATWMVTTFKSGLEFNYGFGFWGPNGHDAIWHLSLIEELKNNFPPENPAFAGIPLENYHYFFDLLLAKASKVFYVNSNDLLFRFFPLVISFLTGFTVFKVSKKISESMKADENTAWLSGIFAVLFIFIGGSFGWVVSFIRDHNFGGEAMFWAQQSISTLLNPPFAISLLILLSGYLLFLNIKNENKKTFLSLALMWGSLIEFKAYAGVLVILSLGLYGLERVLKKDFKPLLLTFAVGLISLLVFLPNNYKSSGLLEFSPFWLVSSMISFQDRLNWQRLALTIDSGVLYKVLLGYFTGLLIFLVGNLGTRIVSGFSLGELLRKRIFLHIVLFGTILPMLFIQKGNNWNIVQFFYYPLAILGIFSGIGLATFSKKVGFTGTIILGVIIVLMTIPTSLSTFPHYLPKRPPAKLGSSEIEALNFLKAQPQGVVLVPAFDETLKEQYDLPLPLAAYTSTSYVSAFSGKRAFMEDTINLEILGVDYKGRLNLIKDILKNNDRSKTLLFHNNISYVYLLNSQKIEVDEGKMGLKNIFQNDEVKIYKVLKD